MLTGWVITDGEWYINGDIREDGSFLFWNASVQETKDVFGSWDAAQDFIKKNDIKGFRIKMVKGDAEKWHIIEPLCRWQNCKDLATYGELCNYHFGL